MITMFFFALEIATQPISLQKPIACTVGTDCFIQQYPDHDTGRGAVDYRCGSAVYNGDDGTTFRILDKQAQERGVEVLAAADGAVQAFRDGQPDFEVGTFDRKKVKGIECGNGVLINHADGWQTQYCHMRKGSVRVETGDIVRAGQVLGHVGQSGLSAVPFLYFSVRHQGNSIDPFTGAMGKCDALQGTNGSLWQASDLEQLVYRDSVVISAGFAADAVTSDDLERGDVAAPMRTSPGLVFYGRAINLQKGDTQTVTLTGPDGKVMIASPLAALDRNKAQYMAFTGKKLTAAAWPAGTYTGTYEVRRGGKVITTRSATFVMK